MMTIVTEQESLEQQFHSRLDRYERDYDHPANQTQQKRYQRN